MPNDTDLQIRELERFVSGNRDLAELEALISRFNIFEALGAENAELRHSSFLAFLLNPNESHGLHDVFLKRFLQASLDMSAEITALTAVNVDITDFRNCEVYIEKDNIDILLHDPVSKLVVIIENKVNSDQHSDQLERYYKWAKHKYPADYEIFGIFLSRFEDPSGHAKYASISHEKICSLVKEVVSRPRILLDPAVKIALEQYSEMLERHFMADQKIQELCTKIYQHHKRALDLIFEHLPNQRDAIGEKLRALIESDSGMTMDDGGIWQIRFLPKSLDIDYFRGGSGWTRSGRMILFEFKNRPNSLQLFMYIGPGPSEKRAAIFDFVRGQVAVFSPEKKLNASWNMIYKSSMLSPTDYDAEPNEILASVENKWKLFLKNDLPPIEKALLGKTWPEV